MKLKIKNKKYMISFCFLALFITVLILLLSHQVTPLKCNLCIDSIRLNDYQLKVRLSYLGSKIPDTQMLIILNNKLSDFVYTNSTSYLNMIAPLDLGQNRIQIKLNNSSVVAYVNYYGNLPILILIPVGAVIFVIVKIFALNADRRKGLAIYIDEDNEKQNLNLLKTSIYAAMDETERQRFVKHLPYTLKETSPILKKYIGNKLLDQDYHTKKMCTLNIIKEKDGFFDLKDIQSEDIAAHKIYNSLVFNGVECKFKKGGSAKELISKNGIIRFSKINQENLSNTILKTDRILLILDSDTKNLSSLIKSFTKLGALMLLLETNGLLSVVYDSF